MAQYRFPNLKENPTKYKCMTPYKINYRFMYYFNYKRLKGRVNEYTEHTKEGIQDRRRVLKDFSKLLDDEIEKIVLFMIEQQGLIAARLEDLGKRRARLQDIPLLQEITELREDYRAVRMDLVTLLKFVELNANAVRKILKKFYERLGHRFTDYYVRSRSNHPYSQLQQVFRHVGIGAVLGALSRSLSDLEERQGSYLNIYDQHHPLSIPKDPIIDLITSTADNLTNSTNFLRFLGQHALIDQADDGAAGAEEEEEEEHAGGGEEDEYHFTSLVLNLANTFLYMVNTYIVVPTADGYATSLGAAATACGAIIGSMAVAQVVLQRVVQPVVLQAVAVQQRGAAPWQCDLHSLTILLVGSVLCGMGSARAVNRRYISDCVPPRIRMQASAAFVSASALGMACGPAIAGLLQTNFSLCGLTVNQITLPGWIMAFGWLAYLIWLWISFREPDLGHGVKDFYEGSSTSTSTRYSEQEKMEQGFGEHLLPSQATLDQDDDDGNGGDNECDETLSSTAALRPASSVASAYTLLTPSVKVQLLIYFMLKYAREIVLSESSVVTGYYFGWSTSDVSVFLATLGLSVLPVNAVVGAYLSNMFEDRQLLVASEVALLAGVAAGFAVAGTAYTAAQYVCSAALTFVAAEVLEGVSLSLLSRAMSSRLSRGTYNGGLLSTEAGTVARVAADATITAAGCLGEGWLLNATLLPALLVCVASIAATLYTYNSLFY
uniref:SPX-domain-containing protein n=1 Tax=Oryza brachyantha TaxID=4533 RepID=A6MCZ5_ORYBR|nr:SPX-domain-containing protein [Oryza brachyantha]